MKKFITILAIAFVSLNFVSCRQDDVTSEMGDYTQQTNNFRKAGTVKSDSIKSVAQKDAAVDPDPPVKDGTSW